MNPKEFSWTEDQQVTVTNPTAQTYKFKVHNKEYELGAGRSAKMPGYIAWVYVYGLSTQMAQADGFFNRWNEEGFRQEYYEKLVAGVDNLVQSIEEVEPDPIQHISEEIETPLGQADAVPAVTDEEVDSLETDATPEEDLPAGGSTYDPESESEEKTAEPRESVAVKPMKAEPKAKALRRGKS